MFGTSACVFGDIETDSVIDDFNDEGVSILIRPNRYRTALEVFEDAVFDGILDKRLDAKGRNEEVLRFDVIDDVEPLVETEFLQREVCFEVLKFLIERNEAGIGESRQVGPEVFSEFIKGVLGFTLIDWNKGRDRGEGVIDEMRLDLRHHDLDLRLFVAFGLIGQVGVLLDVDEKDEDLNGDDDRKIADGIAGDEVLDDDRDGRDEAIDNKGDLLGAVDLLVDDSQHEDTGQSDEFIDLGKRHGRESGVCRILHIEENRVEDVDYIQGDVDEIESEVGDADGFRHFVFARKKDESESEEKKRLRVIHHIEARIESEGRHIANEGVLQKIEDEIDREMHRGEDEEKQKEHLIPSLALLDKQVDYMNQKNRDSDETNSGVKSGFYIHGRKL